MSGRTRAERAPGRARAVGRFGELRGNRDFRLLWVGLATSELGSSISGLAFPLLAFSLSDSRLLAGTAGTVAFVVTWLGQVPGGYVADRFDRRRVMMACDAVRVALFALLAGLVLADAAPVWLLLGVVAVSAFTATTFGPAEGQALRLVVPPDQVPEAVSVSQARAYGADVVGPAVSGALFAAGRAVPFLVDAATFVVSLACVRRIRTPMAPEQRPTLGRLLPDVAEGWAQLWRQPFLRATTVYSAVGNLAVSTLLFVLIVGGAGSGGASVVVGAAVSLAAVAGLVGSLAAPAVQRRVRLRTLLVAVAAVRAVLLLAAAVTGSVVLLGLTLAGVMLLGPVLNAALSAARILVVPGDVLGRVGGASGFVATALQPLAPLAAGLLLQLSSRATALAALAGVFAVAVAVAAVAAGLDVTTTTRAAATGPDTGQASGPDGGRATGPDGRPDGGPDASPAAPTGAASG